MIIGVIIPDDKLLHSNDYPICSLCTHQGFVLLFQFSLKVEKIGLGSFINDIIVTAKILNHIKSKLVYENFWVKQDRNLPNSNSFMCTEYQLFLLLFLSLFFVLFLVLFLGLFLGLSLGPLFWAFCQEDLAEVLVGAAINGDGEA